MRDFVTSPVDCCNVVFAGAPKTITKQTVCGDRSPQVPHRGRGAEPEESTHAPLNVIQHVNSQSVRCRDFQIVVFSKRTALKANDYLLQCYKGSKATDELL